MIHNLLKILIICLLPYGLQATIIWEENFSDPGKGIWGSDNDTVIHIDFSGISTWNIVYSNIELSDSNDYAKTVTTKGGRFEVCDINGEIKWISEWIHIIDFKNININLTAGETGGGANEETKYMNVYYKLNNSDEMLFENKGINCGNWGSNTVSQNILSGDSLQIIVYMSSFYSSDKIILDEIVIEGNYKIDPPTIHKGDIVINELLFDPYPESVDFVELYNKSSSTIWLNRLYLASRDKDDNIQNVLQVSPERIDFLPGTFVLCTTDPVSVLNYYYSKDPDCFLEMPDFPSYSNAEGTVVLLNDSGLIIDEFRYFETMHSPMLYDTEGVSLERISFYVPADDPGNWQSASNMSGYATPGYANSQKESESPENLITINPEYFSPNDDGINDEIKIEYKISSPGYTGNLQVYDSEGRFIIQLANNNLLGTTGEFIWKGKDYNGQNLPPGIYIILFEIFDMNENSKRFKEAVILTDIF